MPVDAGATIAGLEALRWRMDEAVRRSVAAAAHLIQGDAMRKAPVGTPGNSTNTPGDLGRSIDVQGPLGGDGRYEARVGPTVIYGRQRELGGDIYPVMASALRFRRFGEVVYRARVHQEPEPYLKPAAIEMRQPIYDAVLAEVRRALGEGG